MSCFVGSLFRMGRSGRKGRVLDLNRCRDMFQVCGTFFIAGSGRRQGIWDLDCCRDSIVARSSISANRSQRSLRRARQLPELPDRCRSLIQTAATAVAAARFRRTFRAVAPIRPAQKPGCKRGTFRPENRAG